MISVSMEDNGEGESEEINSFLHNQWIVNSKQEIEKITNK